jgi:DNA-binding MarR family transcriptional regulator
MTRALVTSSKFSPGNMTPEALEALFVGREKTLSDVLKRIAASATGEGKHFILLVGARGVGKTHFVALAYHRLMTDPQYAPARARLKVAYLNEEEWGVASFVDLLVRILNALAAGHGDRDLEARIERVYEIHEKDPETARELAQSTLIEYVGKHTLLLLCENLADLFAGLEEEGQKRWRSLIQEHPFWTILATTPALFADVQLQTSPFYGFFTERHLEKLDFETAVQLLRKKAEIDERRDLAGVLGTPTGRARVRSIHHLAGGNHRVYVTMSEFLDRESLDDLVKPFMRMVDDLTPYYQDRMRQLSPQQRKLIEFLSRHETPAMVKEVARRCLISQQTAAKQLGELAKLGFVQSIRSGRTTYYELAEPLMRICIEVKDNKTQHLKLFVRFLREWFTAREPMSRFDDTCSCVRGTILMSLEQYDDVITPEALATMMLIEAVERGPLVMAKQVAAARSALDKPGLDPFIADALMRLLRELTSRALMQGKPWDEAIRALSPALGDLPECELPLKMLGAAARYSRTHDVTDLLDLPLEQRALLLDAFAQQPRGFSLASPAKSSPRRSSPAAAQGSPSRVSRR